MDNNLFRNLDRLTQYGIDVGLIPSNERIYVTNLLIDLLGMNYYDQRWIYDDELSKEIALRPGFVLHDILSKILDNAIDRKLIDEDFSCREIFSTKLMNTMVQRPNQIINRFWKDYCLSASVATSNFFQYSMNTNYINRYRLSQDLRWETQTTYGALQILVSLTKPELEPKAIAKARTHKTNGYPSCALCKENEGYAGRFDFAARQTHRIIPLTLCGTEYYFQFSPYQYMEEHCIVFTKQHIPMLIDENKIKTMFAFLDLFPHYFIGSNADLPYVGGSVLSHEHFQGGKHELPILKATPMKVFEHDDVSEVAILNWPLSTIRIIGRDSNAIALVAGKIIERWRNYTNLNLGIDAGEDHNFHNTMTPLGYKNEGKYILFLMLRNNKTTKERTEGIFHTNPIRYHIKKEGIGIIDAPGLAIMPSRLKEEFQIIKKILITGESIEQFPEIQTHWSWIESMRVRHEFSVDTIQGIIQDEIGFIFKAMLEDCGVFKQSNEGQLAFEEFVSACMTI